VESAVLLDRQTISIKANIGIALLSEPDLNGEALILQADSAMQLARETHRDYRIMDGSHQKQIITRKLLECDLGEAISSGEMELYYQPKVNLHTRRLSGAEALVRWNHPENGLIRPDEFISIAEETLLILPLTIWTLNTALRQSAESRKRWPDFKVAVNLSASILDDELVELVMRALRTWDVSPEHLILEVTENAVMKNPESCLKTLKQLRDEGIELSLDDFGTGYSSFSYLKRLPVQELKIDQSFVNMMLESEDDAHIVQAMIDLGQNFGLRVIAEGIETRETIERLAEMGCQSGQGYYIARPMPHTQLLDWIGNSAWTTTSTADKVVRDACET
jgi:EAL domain-containing protein (putative c-di-GMP-specific phosphodiesterase class I)